MKILGLYIAGSRYATQFFRGSIKNLHCDFYDMLRFESKRESYGGAQAVGAFSAIGVYIMLTALSLSKYYPEGLLISTAPVITNVLAYRSREKEEMGRLFQDLDEFLERERKRP